MFIMKKYGKVKPFRLNLYSKYVTNFDNLDQTLKFRKIEKKINVIHLTKVKTSQSFTFINYLWLEILTQQRFLLKQMHKFDSQNLIATISKKNLPIILDVYLNSIFVKKLKNFYFTHNIIYNKIHFFISNQINSNLYFFTFSKYVVYIDIKDVYKQCFKFLQ